MDPRKDSLSPEARAIKTMLERLEKGESPEALKEEFNKVFGDKPVSAISDAEQELMKEGMDSCQLSGLCEVHHASVSDSVSQMQKQLPSFYPPHPLAYFQLDAQKMMDLFREGVRPVVHGAQPLELLEERLRAFLSAVDRHFNLKELVFFAYLDKHNISGPTRVMWSSDDEIRDAIKSAVQEIVQDPTNVRGVVQYMHPCIGKLNEMIAKERDVLIPLLAETLSDEEMEEASAALLEIGYNFDEARLWTAPKQEKAQTEEEYLKLPTGKLNSQELVLMLNKMGVEITFVAADDTLHYYSQPDEMHFLRTKANLGANVYTCHPHKSHEMVKEVLTRLKSGQSEVESRIAFKNGKEFLVDYRALRDADGRYLGCLETVTDLTKQAELLEEMRKHPQLRASR